MSHMAPEHTCELPWHGPLYHCPCGRWYETRTFHDPDTGDTWRGWAPLDEEAA